MAHGESSDQERTEQATARRREEARQKGQIAKSADLGPAVVLLGAAGMWGMMGGHLTADGVDLLRRTLLELPTRDLTANAALTLLLDRLYAAAGLMWPFFLVPAAASVAAQLLQTRFSVSSRGLTPDWSRLNVFRGIGHMLSARSLAELLKALLKLGSVGTVAYTTVRSAWPALLTLGQGGQGAMLSTLGRVIWDVWLGVAVSYLVLAALDYGHRWWEHERSLRMTREEVREESKQSEGNPLLRGRLRSIHRQMVTRQLVKQVKRADVVLRNPTHVAVALKYESGRGGAPRVVAKGAELMAARIVEIARRHHVPIVQNPPLARTLYALVKVGREIPPDLYRAVAEVLAYVYSLRPGRR